MSKDLQITTSQDEWTAPQLAALTQLGLQNAPKADLAVFLHQAKRTGLDPFARQIYMINRGGKFTIQTSIDGFRIVAQRSGNYGGQTPAEWCGEDGEWIDVWLGKTPPLAARVGVYYKDSPHPTYAVAKWDSYAQQSPIWKKMPDLMLAKCAEALALRKAFPNDLSGVYTDEELDQSEPEARIKPVKLEVIENPAPVTEEELNSDDGNFIIEEIDNAGTLTELREIYARYKHLLDFKTETPAGFVKIKDYFDVAASRLKAEKEAQ